VVVFVVCWTPWNVHSLLAEFLHESIGGPHFKFIDLLLKAFAVSSAAVNPFLYCWLNANFRHVTQHTVKITGADLEGFKGLNLLELMLYNWSLRI